MMFPSKRTAFTLIETLLAVAIAAVVFTLAISLFTSTSRTLLGQEKRLAGDVKSLEAFRVLEKDLYQAISSPGNTNQLFAVNEDPDQKGYSLLRFSSLRRLPDEADLRWMEVIDVTYRVTKDRELIREVQRHVGPVEGPGARQVLLRDIDLFSITAIQSGEEFEAWPRTEKDRLPAGVGIAMATAADGKEPLSSRVLIPAAMVIKPEIERGASVPALRP